jgi:hypothetical protein
MDKNRIRIRITLTLQPFAGITDAWASSQLEIAVKTRCRRYVLSALIINFRALPWLVSSPRVTGPSLFARIG